MALDNKARCAYPGCENAVRRQDYCYGCQQHTCEAHGTNYLAMGKGHHVSLHWQPVGTVDVSEVN